MTKFQRFIKSYGLFLVLFILVLMGHFAIANYHIGNYSLIHYAFFFLCFWLCGFSFTQNLLKSFLFSILTFTDRSLFLFSSQATSYFSGRIWNQSFLILSLFLTPILAKQFLSLNTFTLSCSLMIIPLHLIALLPLFSTNHSIVPLSIVVCSLFTKLYQLIPSNRNGYHHLMYVILVVILYFVSHEFIIQRYPLIADKILSSPIIDKVYFILTKKPSTDLIGISVIPRNDDYLSKFYEYFNNTDTNPYLAILYIAISKICTGSQVSLPLYFNSFYENCFLIIAISSFFTSSFEPFSEFSPRYGINFFVFQSYLLLAFEIYCSQMQSSHFYLFYFCILAISVYSLCETTNLVSYSYMYFYKYIK